MGDLVHRRHHGVGGDGALARHELVEDEPGGEEVEAGAGVGVGGARGHDLDRDVAVERLVPRAVDGSHRPAAELGEDEVAPDAGGDRHGRMISSPP